MKRTIIASVTVLSIALPAFLGAFGAFGIERVAAQTPSGQASADNPTVQDPQGATAPSASSFQLVSCTPTFDPLHPGVLKNDCDWGQLVKTASRLIKFVLYMITPILILMLMYTGFKYMMAGGDANLVADAKRMMKPIFLGIFLIFAAWLIVYTLLDKFLADKLGTGSDAITKQQIIGK